MEKGQARSDGHKCWEELREYSRIISGIKNCLVFNCENVSSIISACELKISADTPVCIIGVIGPAGCGKSLLANLLIQYYENNGEGGWLQKLTKTSEVGGQIMYGFAVDHVDSPSLIKSNTLSEDAIHLWPVPFQLDSPEGGSSKPSVWIMDIDSAHLIDGSENMKLLEQFVALSCSRIVEIEWNNVDIRILELCQEITSWNTREVPNASKIKVCDSLVYVIRSSTTESRLKSGTNEEARAELKERAKSKGDLDASLFEKFKHLNVIWMKESSQPLHDQAGVWNGVALKSMTKVLKNVISTIVDDGEVLRYPKMVRNGEELTIGNMKDYLKSCFDHVYHNNKVENIKSISDKNETQESCSPAIEKVPDIPDAPLPDSDSELTSGSRLEKIDEDKVTTIPATSEVHSPSPPVTPATQLAESVDEGHSRQQALVHTLITETEHEQEQRIRKSRTRTPSRDIYHDQPQPRPPSEPFAANTESVPLIPNSVPTNTNTKSAYFPPNNLPAASYSTSSIGNKHRKNLETTENVPVMKLKENTGLLTAESVNLQCNADAVQFNNAVFSKHINNDATCEAPSDARNCSEAMDVDGHNGTVEKMDVDNEDKMNESLEQLKEQQRSYEQQLLQQRGFMEECISTALLHTHHIMGAYLKKWIETQLNIWNTKDIGNVYQCTMEEICHDYKGKIDPCLHQEFHQRLNELTQDLKDFVTKVQQAVDEFNSRVRKRFEFHGCFTESKLNGILENELRKVNTRITDTNILGFVKPSCERLMIVYVKHNMLIIDIEKELTKTLALEAKNLYNDEMKRYLKMRHFSPDKLAKLNENLVKKCVEAFEKAFYMSGQPNQVITEETADLKKTLLHEAFPFHKQRNESKLRKLQGEINKIIEVYKKQYVEKTEDLLQRNPNGMEARDLSTHYTTILNEIKMLLEMDIRNKISQDEPVEAHWKSLQAYTDTYWKTVLEENNKNIRKKQEREENEKRERLRLEAQQKLDQQMQVQERKKTLDNRGTSVNGSCHSAPVSKPTSAINHLQQTTSSSFNSCTKKLPPIVFQFTYSRVVMGMLVEGKTKVVKNEWGEDFTVPVIGLTKNGTLIYGSDAIAHLLPDAGEEKKLLKTWAIGEYIISNDSPWGERIHIEDQELPITFEFLLGYFLNKLKRSTEVKMGGTLTAALITLPFWLTSTQRIQIKDSARIAGFSDIFLVNEASAAVYACAMSEHRRTTANNILVLSESSDHLDAFVYSYNGAMNKIRMESHAGNYCLQQKKKSVLGRAKEWLSYVLSTDNKNSKDDCETQSIRNVCKQALGQYHDKSNNSNKLPNEMLVVCESEDRREILESVGKNFGRKAGGIKVEEVVLQGSVLLTQKNYKDIGEYVKDKLAFDVLRTSGTDAGKQVINKEDYLPCRLKKHVTDLPAKHDDARFYQTMMDARIPIGDLVVKDVSTSQSVVVHLEINNEGIVKLKYVTIKSTNSQDSTLPLDETKFTWKTLNLTDNELAQYASFMTTSNCSQQQEPEPTPLDIAKQALKEKCKEMQQNIENGKVTFKSDLGKSIATKQIAEAIRFAEHQNASLGEINKQSGIITKLYSKYFQES